MKRNQKPVPVIHKLYLLCREVEMSRSFRLAQKQNGYIEDELCQLKLTVIPLICTV